eukprot:GHVT01062267.1.p1 GENE.GHVT01062267.1~~GHVT01062267.1.p1  ORF type:complete len:154 (+),score=21.02 GHVT01062267.1:635-1096(+)
MLVDFPPPLQQRLVVEEKISWSKKDKFHLDLPGSNSDTKKHQKRTRQLLKKTQDDLKKKQKAQEKQARNEQKKLEKEEKAEKKRERKVQEEQRRLHTRSARQQKKVMEKERKDAIAEEKRSQKEGTDKYIAKVICDYVTSSYSSEKSRKGRYR